MFRQEPEHAAAARASVRPEDLSVHRFTQAASIDHEDGQKSVDPLAAKEPMPMEQSFEMPRVWYNPITKNNAAKFRIFTVQISHFVSVDR